MKHDFYLRETISLKPVDDIAVGALSDALGVPQALARILVARNLTTFDECKAFFRPDLSNLHDPFLFPQMQRSVERILQACKKNELIYIYGDYDVDGITATVLLVRVLTRLGASVNYYIPHRLTEGYGISQKGMEYIANQGAAVIISVDCGITAVDEVAWATSRGIDIIVTDHHEPHGIVPSAFALCNPKIPLCPYPDKNLAGVGVALKLCQALAIASGHDNSLWFDYCDIVALGTAADIVPLTGENRIIVKYGFEQLGGTRNIGLQKLMQLQTLTRKKLTTNDIVFGLAPCINAGGRVGDSQKAARLLLTENEQDASLYAQELVSMNRQRQMLDANVQEQAVAWVLSNVNLDKEYAIVAGAPDWHVGVIGIVASKIAEKFCRPTFLFSVEKNGMARGSGRSIPSVHLLEILQECRHILQGFGGHAAAAGATIKTENLPEFRSHFNEILKTKITKDALIPLVIADAELTIKQLTPKFYRILKQMEPFGPGNRRPVFFCKNVSNRYTPRVVGKNHLKMTVTSEGAVMDAIAFNFGERLQDTIRNPSFGLAFAVDENTWNGRTTLQMRVKGIAL